MSLRADRNSAQAVISLPAPQLEAKVSLEETIARRRSVRRYSRQPLDLSQLSQVLWSAQGITGSRRLRAVPSAGATYPLAVFVLVGRKGVAVREPKQPPTELQASVYRYQVDSHYLFLQKNSRSKTRPSQSKSGPRVHNQRSCGYCPLRSLPQDFQQMWQTHREIRSHGGRTQKGQNIHLQAVSLGLATVEVGAFRDEAVSEVLGLDEQIKPLHIMPVGKPL